MSTQEKGINWIAVITMMFLCGMIAFVTYLGQPMANVWKYQPGIDGSAVMGVMGNAVVFLAYLFMGIPAGILLGKIGYKKMALVGIATGFVAMLIQFLSGKIGLVNESMVVPYCVYLFGSFIGGFSVCMLNMVVNPMLNLLGGGGNRGNQLNMAGMTFNSLTATITPMFVGMLVGTVTASTSMADCNLVMYIALAVFAASFAILSFVPIQDPEGSTASDEKIGVFAPLKFRHCLLGVVAIFAYMGVEAGIPSVMTAWLTDKTDSPLIALGVTNLATVTGSIVAVYWFLMFIGRLIGAAIGGKVSSRVMMIVTSALAIIFIIVGATLPSSVTVTLPAFLSGNKEEAPTEVVAPTEVPEMEIKVEVAVPVATAEVAAPVVEAPVVEAPVVEAPVVEAPVVEAPVVAAPVVEAPVVAAPVVEAPVVEAPVVEMPVVEEKVAEVVAETTEKAPAGPVQIPLSALLFALCGLCTSVMWPAIFNLATEKLGKYTAAASGLFMTMVVGGGVFQVIQSLLIGSVGYMISFIVPLLALAYIFNYAFLLSKPQADIEEAVK